MRHIYLVLEGGDGAGKTSIRKHLFRRLVEEGHEVLTVTRRRGSSLSTPKSSRTPDITTVSTRRRSSPRRTSATRKR